MNTTEILLSICIPTNGITEWVVPVLESIFVQERNDFEVVITDNGNDEKFREKMLEYTNKYSNLFYYKTEAIGFLNQIEAFKKANGKFVKFLNHRMSLKSNSLDELISFVERNVDEKPIIYFTNGNRNSVEKQMICNGFDEYINQLGIWSTWSAGVAFWKADFEDMFDSIQFNRLFPHTGILYGVKEGRKYIIDDRHLFDDLPVVDETKKGNYDFYYAFSVEYIFLLQQLLVAGEISSKTFCNVKKAICYYIVYNFIWYNILKKKTAYDVTGYKKSLFVNYSRGQIIIEFFVVIFSACWHKVRNLFRSEG